MEPRDLPDGTVSMLFTDVEGSTRMLQEVGREAYVRALTEHRRLVREAVATNAGIEVEMQGDSFFFAFPFARQAVAAAVAAQRALHEHEWEAAPIRVRIGIHTGEPMQADGLYAGIDVHRAARVMSVARGSQVLLSARTADLVEGELPERTALRNLGEYALKDFSAPQRLYVVDIEGLPSEAPTGTPISPARRRRRSLLLVGALIVAVAAIGVGWLATRAGGDPVTAAPNSVAIVDPAKGSVATTVAVGTTPTSVVSGGGSIWVLNSGELTITQIDIRTRDRVRTFSAGPQASDIAFADGSLWVADAEADIIRILDAGGGVEARVRLGIEHAGSQGAVGRPVFRQVALATSGDSVWAVGGAGLTAVEIDARTHRVLRRVTGVRAVDGDRSPAGPDVGVGAAGVWATAGADELFRVDVLPREVVQLGGFGGDEGVSGVAVDEDVWAAGAGVAWQIQPRLARPVGTYPVGARPLGVALGNGSVWTANSAGGSVTRIDSESRHTTTIVVGGAPRDLVIAGGLVWVTVD